MIVPHNTCCSLWRPISSRSRLWRITNIYRMTHSPRCITKKKTTIDWSHSSIINTSKCVVNLILQPWIRVVFFYVIREREKKNATCALNDACLLSPRSSWQSRVRTITRKQDSNFPRTQRSAPTILPDRTTLTLWCASFPFSSLHRPKSPSRKSRQSVHVQPTDETDTDTEKTNIESVIVSGNICTKY